MNGYDNLCAIWSQPFHVAHDAFYGILKEQTQIIPVLHAVSVHIPYLAMYRKGTTEWTDMSP